MNRADDRGVSDVVSFTLVFSTIIFMIGVVTVTGIGTLGEIQQGTESNVAEETMRNYAATLADHRTTGAERRSTTIKMQGHQLELVNSTLGWSVDNGSRENITTRALVRTTDTGSKLIYENGALFRVHDDNGVVVRKPPLRCSNDTAHLAVTKIRGDFSISSDTRVTLQSDLKNQRITTRQGEGINISLYTNGTQYTKETQTPDRWNSVLGGRWQEGAGVNEYTCSPIDRLVIHETTVDISIVN
ncbi:DUF7289 family protein [Haloarcula laminariae]|uniref:DUF7289 family protein n=1 Tax=Haloarcula laminariae TaxID=2961577 RepID=UPI0024049153|nr:hypothetical protein [Halomicroarcula sp. FL173]